MWTRRLEVHRGMLALLAVAIVWCGALAAWHAMRSTPVAVAAAFDLVITAGAAMYFIGVRGGHLPNWALRVTVAGGVIVAKLLLSRVDVRAVGLIAVGTLELGTIALVVIRARRARRAWLIARADGSGVQGALVTALVATGLPARIAELVATEVTIMGYGVVGWRAPRGDCFTVHRTSGWSLIAGVFIALTLVEVPLVHLVLVVAGVPTAATIVSALSLYGALWLAGDAHALRHGGLRLGARALELELGVRWRGSIPYAAIERVERAQGPADLDVAIATANVVVVVRDPVVLRGLFGRRRTVRSIALELDEPDAFATALRAHVNPNDRA
jgi:hypothetical protein